MPLTVIPTIISFPLPTHSFIPGLKPSFSANPFKFPLQPIFLFPRFLLLLLSISVFTF